MKGGVIKVAKEGGMPDGVKSAIAWTIGLSSIALMLVIVLILFGNLSGSLGWTDDSNTLTNETIVIGLTTGTSTLSVASDTNFTGWNDILILNASIGPALTETNETLEEGVDYTVFSNNGTFQNITGTWNRTFVTYSVTTTSQGEVDTENVIGNYSESAVNTSAQFPVVGTIIGIAVLLVVLIGILIFAITKMMAVANMGGGSNSSFG